MKNESEFLSDFLGSFFLKRSERKMWVLVREREEEEEDLKCEVVKKKKGFGLEVNNF